MQKEEERPEGREGKGKRAGGRSVHQGEEFIHYISFIGHLRNGGGRGYRGDVLKVAQ